MMSKNVSRKIPQQVGAVAVFAEEARHAGTACLNELAKIALSKIFTFRFCTAIFAALIPFIAMQALIINSFASPINYPSGSKFTLGDYKLSFVKTSSGISNPTLHVTLYVPGFFTGVDPAHTYAVSLSPYFYDNHISSNSQFGAFTSSTGVYYGPSYVDHVTLSVSNLTCSNSSVTFNYVIKNGSYSYFTFSGVDGSSVNSLQIDFDVTINNFSVDASRIVHYYHTRYGIEIFNYVDLNQYNAQTSINDSIIAGNEAAQERFDQEVSTANQGTADVSSSISSLQGLESKWEILWYPISFTNDLLDVFKDGSSSSTFATPRGYISGYAYDPETGLLEPQYSRTRSSSGGAVITFPAFTLPVLDVQIWDEYEYDISSLREQFPALFNASDVIITCMELYWCIAFLRNKYIDIFGN